MDMKIAKHGWVQVGGDMDPGTHGGVIARADGHSIEIREIQPVREFVGDDEALEVGFPFWSKDGHYDLDDLSLSDENVQSAMRSHDMTLEGLRELKPESRAMAIAEMLLMHGSGSDEGPSGWAKDVVPGKVKWWGSKNPAGWRYIADEDVEFKQLQREARRR